jgi:hypothetical protein
MVAGHARARARRRAIYGFARFTSAATRFATSCWDCRSNLISDSVSARGVEPVTCFRLCKAVEVESEALAPPVFKFLFMLLP